MMRPERHRFVTLKSSWRDHAILSPCGIAAGELLPDWVDAGRPLIVASSAAGDGETTIRLGLSTPEKRRLGLCVALEAINRVLPPVALEDAATSAPDEWQDTIRMISKTAARFGLSLSVFGSLAWTHLSGESHLHAGSDLDLLVSTSTPDSSLEAVQSLLEIAGKPRLDGELLLTDGSGVNLREYAARPSRILIKQHGGPRLVEYSSLMSVARSAA